MKAVILNAGMGQRLGRHMPKCLNYINKKEKIIDRQLRLLESINAPIYCVVGFKKEIIMEEYPHMNFIYNEKYHQTNTSKSLLKALETIKENGDILWLNGDVFLPDDFSLREFVNQPGNLILCNIEANCADEEVKYSTNGNGRITAISKTVTKSEGEALGLNLIRSDYVERFRISLQQCDPQDYFEKACEILIDEGVPFKAYCTDKHVVEIDTHEDLASVYNHS